MGRIKLGFLTGDDKRILFLEVCLTVLCIAFLYIADSLGEESYTSNGVKFFSWMMSLSALILFRKGIKQVLKIRLPKWLPGVLLTYLKNLDEQSNGGQTEEETQAESGNDETIS